MATTSMRRAGKPSVSSKASLPIASELSELVASGLTSSFEALRDKVSQSIGDKGDQYLHEAATKMDAATTQLVAWCKKHPVKLAIGVASLTAVSAFIAHTMSSHGGSASGARPSGAKAKRRMAAGAARK